MTTSDNAELHTAATYPDVEQRALLAMLVSHGADQMAGTTI